jgi:hypothetical protein
MPTTATHLWRPSGARRVVLDGFAPVPRGTIPTTPSPLVWPAKDPADALDFEFDITEALLANRGDSIATLDVTLSPAGPGDLSLTQTAVDGAIAILWLAGGQIGTTYSVTLTIGTSNGRTISRIVLLPVQSLATAPEVLNTLQTNTGAVITDQSGNPILIGS